MTRRHLALGGALVALALAAACGEYGHTNPYDPMVNVTGQVAGPDSSFAVLDTLAFQLSTSAEFPDLTVKWSSDNPAVMESLGNGRFVTHQTDGGITVNVFAEAGPHRFQRPVSLRQRVARFLDCPGSTPYRTPVNLTVARYGMLACVRAVDARGFVVNDQGASPGTLVSRNEAVVHAGTVFFNMFMFDAMQDGSSWLVLTPARGAPDSLLVTVLRRITQAAVSPGSYLTVRSGESMQLAFVYAYDASMLRITSPATIGTPRFFDCSSPAGGISVTPDGLLTGVSATPAGKVCLAFTRDTVVAATVGPPPPAF